MKRYSNSWFYHWWFTNNNRFHIVLDLTSWKVGFEFSRHILSINMLCLSFEFSLK